jgi:hypothetical protein
MSKKTEPAPPKTAAEQRAERLQAALRDNLRRRKAAQAQPDLTQPDTDEAQT